MTCVVSSKQFLLLLGLYRSDTNKCAFMPVISLLCDNFLKLHFQKAKTIRRVPVSTSLESLVWQKLGLMVESSDLSWRSFQYWASWITLDCSSYSLKIHHRKIAFCYFCHNFVTFSLASCFSHRPSKSFWLCFDSWVVHSALQGYYLGMYLLSYSFVRPQVLNKHLKHQGLDLSLQSFWFAPFLLLNYLLLKKRAFISQLKVYQQ